MNFYLRKRMRLGPVFFKLTGSAEGLNVARDTTLNVRGSEMEEYKLGSRLGLYYRKIYKGKRLNPRQAQEGSRGILLGAFFIALSFVAASVVLWPTPLVPIIGFIVLGTLGGSLMYVDAQHCRWMFDVKKKLDAALIDPDHLPTSEEAEELYHISREVSFPVPLREEIYLAVLDKVIDDKVITEQESSLLKSARYILSLSGQQVSDLHKELLSSAWLELLEQGKFDQQDLTWIEKLRGELEVPETEVESEWAVVKELLSIKETDKNLSPITDSSASSLLNPDETLYATGPAHLLHNVKLNSSGLKDDKEAQYFITSQRVLIRGAKNTEIPLKVLDRIELNVDQRYLLLHCKGELKTTRFRTQNPVETGILLSNMENAA